MTQEFGDIRNYSHTEENNRTQEFDQTQKNGDYLEFDIISNYSQTEEMNSIQELDIDYSITQEINITQEYEDYEDAYYMQMLDNSQETQLFFIFIYILCIHCINR